MLSEDPLSSDCPLSSELTSSSVLDLSSGSSGDVSSDFSPEDFVFSGVSPDSVPSVDPSCYKFNVILSSYVTSHCTIALILFSFFCSIIYGFIMSVSKDDWYAIKNPTE